MAEFEILPSEGQSVVFSIRNGDYNILTASVAAIKFMIDRHEFLLKIHPQDATIRCDYTCDYAGSFINAWLIFFNKCKKCFIHCIRIYL